MQLIAFELGYNRGDFLIEEQQAKIILIPSINQFLKKNRINFISKTINESYE
jgi:hypothetical protein